MPCYTLAARHTSNSSTPSSELIHMEDRRNLHCGKHKGKICKQNSECASCARVLSNREKRREKTHIKPYCARSIVGKRKVSFMNSSGCNNSLALDVSHIKSHRRESPRQNFTVQCDSKCYRALLYDKMRSIVCCILIYEYETLISESFR